MATEPGRGAPDDTIQARLARMHAAGRWSQERGAVKLMFSPRCSSDWTALHAGRQSEPVYWLQCSCVNPVSPAIVMSFLHLKWLPDTDVRYETPEPHAALLCLHEDSTIYADATILRSQVTDDAQLRQLIVRNTWKIVDSVIGKAGHGH